MGYFSNGTEGEMYEAEYCDNCVHHLKESECPVLQAHLLWNYEECNKPDSILHKMIPRIKVDLKCKDGTVMKDFPTNGECIFFEKRKEGE